MGMFMMATGRTRKVMDVFFRLLSVVTFFTSGYLLVERMAWRMELESSAHVRGVSAAVSAYRCGKSELIASDFARNQKECFPDKLSTCNPVRWIMWMLTEPVRVSDDAYACGYNGMMEEFLKRQPTSSSP